MIHDFLSFYIVVSKCEKWKEESIFMVGPGRQLASLCHSSGACGWILPRLLKL